MSDSKRESEDLIPLSALLSGGDAGDCELEQILRVLWRHAWAKDGEWTQLTPGLWTSDRALCIVRLPSGRGVRQHSKEGSTREYFATLYDKREINQLLVVDPTFAEGESPDDGFGSLVHQAREHLSPRDRMVWDAAKLQDLVCSLPPLGIRYYPEFVPDGRSLINRILRQRRRYDEEFAKLHAKIQFVGMSVYKEETSASVNMDRIYIPLRVVPEGADDADPKVTRVDPLALIEAGSRNVILGDPGSGKSTLLRFLALAGSQPGLRKRFGTRKDHRLPLLVVLRHYADELKSRSSLGLLDYLVETASRELDIPKLDRVFFEYHLYAGQALLLVDGIDELPGPEFKLIVRKRIGDFLEAYPGNSAVVTSRVYGYDKDIRYESIGFSHHRVARLSLDNIKTFVGHWYAAKIEAKHDRNMHVEDLVRIIEEPDSQALRDLARNPLLLTIICLVHRIDAVLPDERVVLYQKCTETLLNTWHAWKYRSEPERRRNKVEKRNRARMEYTAYWMHCLLEDPGQKGRAVVRYDDLKETLAEYIEEIENPAKENPETLAEVFLRFVKERAGLLVEVGDGLYSFVHLTFQEYLTATHLRKSGETWGIDVIWKFIKDRCKDDRWHEVIRLLIGSLQLTKSQAGLLERILPEEGDADFHERSLLAGGCLLDGIEAAEDMSVEIVHCLLLSAANAQQLDELRNPLKILRAWQDRETENRSVVAQAVGKLWQGLPEEMQSALVLSLVSLDWEDAAIWEACGGRLGRYSRASVCFAALLAKLPCDDDPLPQSDREMINSASAWMSCKSSAANFGSAILQVICRGCLRGRATPSFTQILTCLGSGTILGPTVDLLRNYVMLAGRRVETRLGLGESLQRDLKHVRDRVPNLDRIRDPDPTWARVEARARTMEFDLDDDWDIHGDVYRAAEIGMEQKSLISDETVQCGKAPFLQYFLETSKLYSPILDIICDLLALTPRAQWWEALRLRALPSVAERVTVAQPEVWKRTHDAFAYGGGTENDREHASTQLLLDIWLYIHCSHETPEESPFASLAALTRDVDSAPLRVAHCLRDLAYGIDVEARTEDLERMLNSDNPEFRHLFEKAFWREPSTD